ncbi:MAG: hypothetical protein FJZ16_05710 [Candidatus Omnitrophica bacterium]|nr:hypothetical protein [Candidatus Omnitrophota bacterium]
MPAFDQTGPQGQGPMSGRGLGPCAMPAGRQGFGGGFLGRGRGWSFGRGFGWKRGIGFGRGLGRFFGWNWPQSKADQKQSLADYKKALQEELKDVEEEEKQLNTTE